MEEKSCVVHDLYAALIYPLGAYNLREKKEKKILLTKSACHHVYESEDQRMEQLLKWRVSAYIYTTYPLLQARRNDFFLFLFSIGMSNVNDHLD